MRSIGRLFIAATASVAIGCAASNANEPVTNSVWGSNSANLTVQADGANLRFLAAGGCVGSYVDAANLFTSLSIDVPGTFTRLTGAFPGKLTYPAQVTGSMRGDALRLTVSVPALSLLIGPIDLTRGVSHSWPNCLYP